MSRRWPVDRWLIVTVEAALDRHEPKKTNGVPCKATLEVQYLSATNHGRRPISGWRVVGAGTSVESRRRRQKE